MPKAKTIRELMLHSSSSNPFIHIFNRYTGNRYYLGGYIDCPNNLKDLPLVSVYSETKGGYDIINCSVELT